MILGKSYASKIIKDASVIIYSIQRYTIIISYKFVNFNMNLLVSKKTPQYKSINDKKISLHLNNSKIFYLIINLWVFYFYHLIVIILDSIEIFQNNLAFKWVS
jgi:hypothetical protein